MVDHAEAFEERAREVLPEPVFRYIRQGARDGVSAAEAVRAWDGFRFLPRVLQDVREIETGTSLLGHRVSAPIAVAPSTFQRAAHPEGEVAMARAAASTGSLMVLSSNAGSSFSAIAETGVAWWLQAYLTQDRSACEDLLAAGVAAGASAVVLTVDTPVVGTKYDGDGPTVWEVAEPSWLRANFPPGHGDAPGHEKARDLSVEDLRWLGTTTGLPVVVKGVLRPDDAARCVDAGAAAVWVSNHGGRQLDYSAATADALAGVADAVGVSAEVYVDGGVRNGRHALAALSLGARAVFLGRPPLFALAAEGEPGVRRLLRQLRDELVEAMALSGCHDVRGARSDLLRPSRPIRAADLRNHKCDRGHGKTI